MSEPWRCGYCDNRPGGCMECGLGEWPDNADPPDDDDDDTQQEAPHGGR